MSLEAVPRFGFSAGAMDPGENLAAWRSAMATFFDVDEVGHGEEGPFRASLMSYGLGPVLFGLARAGGQRFSRSTATISRSGVDHIIVQAYRQGGFEGVAGGMPVRVQAGDVCVFDLAQTLETRATAFENITLVIPRPMLGARLPQPEMLHGVVLPGEGALAQLLGRHFAGLLDAAPRLDRASCQAVAEGTVALVLACLHGEMERRDAAQAGSAALSLIRIRSHIEANLADPGLSAGSIAAHFGLSRASLYRVLAPLGGVADYIRSRRLHRALFELAADGRGEVRVGEVSRRWHFGSEASFARAFKAAYGITPSSAREAARLGSRDPDAPDAVPALTRWMRAIAPPAAPGGQRGGQPGRRIGR